MVFLIVGQTTQLLRTCLSSKWGRYCMLAKKNNWMWPRCEPHSGQSAQKFTVCQDPYMTCPGRLAHISRWASVNLFVLGETDEDMENKKKLYSGCLTMNLSAISQYSLFPMNLTLRLSLRSTDGDKAGSHFTPYK